MALKSKIKSENKVKRKSNKVKKRILRERAELGAEGVVGLLF